MEGTNNNLRLYSLSQAARKLGLGRDTLKNLIDQGKLGTITILKRKKVPEEELQRFLTQNTKVEIKPAYELDVNSFVNESFRKRNINTDKMFDTMIKEIK